MSTAATIQDASLEELELETINAAVYNPRKDLKPGDKAWKDIETNLLRFGNVGGMVYNRQTGNLVGGHQRLKILRHHGRTKAIFAIVNLGIEEEQALNVALNRLGEGSWDKTRLADLLAKLKTGAFDIESLGFSKPDLTALMKRETKVHKADPDSVNIELSNQPLSKLGDIYDIITTKNHHRLICGDSRKMDTFNELMQGAKASLINVDPPYGVSYNSSTRGEGTIDRGTILNDDLQKVALTEFLIDIFRNAASASHDEAAMYCWHAVITSREFYAAMDRSGWQEYQTLIWAKRLVLSLSRSHYHWSHEPAFYARKHNQRPKFYGDRKNTTMFHDSQPDFTKLSKEEAINHLRDLYEEFSTTQKADRDSNWELIHPTQKPIAIPSRAILNSSQAADLVLDMCGGSGSTAIACEETDRNARIVELDPRFTDGIVRRFFATYETPPKVLRNGKEIVLQDFGNQAVADSEAKTAKRRKKTAKA